MDSNLDDNLDIIEKMPPLFAEMIELIGMEDAVLISKRYGGQLVYIPKVDMIERLQRNKNIRDEFTGYNYRGLSQKYNLSENQIRIITNDIAEKKRSAPMEGQLSLLDVEEC